MYRTIQETVNYDRISNNWVHDLGSVGRYVSRSFQNNENYYCLACCFQ